MTKFRVSKIFPYSQETLYNTVSCIKSYPEFLPWCHAAHILSEKPGEMWADLTIGYAFFQETLRSKVLLSPHSKIEVDYQQGPLKALVNRWQFHSIGKNTTEVDFFIAFTFQSQLMQKAMDSFFEEGAKKLMSAFEQRLRT